MSTFLLASKQRSALLCMSKINAQKVQMEKGESSKKPTDGQTSEDLRAKVQAPPQTNVPPNLQKENVPPHSSGQDFPPPWKFRMSLPQTHSKMPPPPSPHPKFPMQKEKIPPMKVSKGIELESKSKAQEDSVSDADDDDAQSDTEETSTQIPETQQLDSEEDPEFLKWVSNPDPIKIADAQVLNATNSSSDDLLLMKKSQSTIKVDSIIADLNISPRYKECSLEDLHTLKKIWKILMMKSILR